MGFYLNYRKLKEWLQKCAGATVKLLQPIQWITPLGMPVVQPYLIAEKKHGSLCLVPVRHKQVLFNRFFKRA